MIASWAPRPPSTRSTPTNRREARGGARRVHRELRQQYRADIDILKLADELHVDAITPGDELRAELSRRFANAATKTVTSYPRRRSVLPV